MPTTHAPRSEAELAANAREAAQLLLAHPIALQMSAVSVDLLLDLAHRDIRVPATPPEACWLHRAILAAMEIEAHLGREAGQ